MAMNKKEIELVEDMKTKLALRFTEEILPDIDKPSSEKMYEIINGWSFNSYSLRIEKSCSSSHFHSISNWDKTTSQQGIKQYSSRLLALKAMRHEVELKCAKELRKIDLMIEKEIADDLNPN